MNEKVKAWLIAAAIRAGKTAAQNAISVIGATKVMGEVDWLFALSTAVLAAILSILTSLAGIPEAGDVPVTKLVKEE